MLQILENSDYDMATEAVVDLANYFGEDSEIACEGVKSFFDAAGAKVKALCKRIREFIQRVIAWIKNKFEVLIKREKITVESDYWKTANSVLSQIKRSNPSVFDKIKKFRADFTIDHLKDNAELSGKKKDQFAVVSKLIDDANAELVKIYESKEYVAASHHVNEKGRATQMVSLAPLREYRQKIADSLKQLESDQKELEKLATKMPAEAYSLSAKGISYSMKKVNMLMGVVNEIMASSRGRSQSKMGDRYDDHAEASAAKRQERLNQKHAGSAVRF